MGGVGKTRIQKNKTQVRGDHTLLTTHKDLKWLKLGFLDGQTKKFCSDQKQMVKNQDYPSHSQTSLLLTSSLFQVSKPPTEPSVSKECRSLSFSLQSLITPTLIDKYSFYLLFYLLILNKTYGRSIETFRRRRCGVVQSIFQFIITDKAKTKRGGGKVSVL